MADQNSSLGRTGRHRDTMAVERDRSSADTLRYVWAGPVELQQPLPRFQAVGELLERIRALLLLQMHNQRAALTVFAATDHHVEVLGAISRERDPVTVTNIPRA